MKYEDFLFVIGCFALQHGGAWATAFWIFASLYAAVFFLVVVAGRNNRRVRRLIRRRQP